jgi:hypothetical protein
MLQLPAAEVLLREADSIDLQWSATTLDQNMMPTQISFTNDCATKTGGDLQLRLTLGTLTVTFDGTIFNSIDFPGEIHVLWTTNDQSRGRSFEGHDVTYTGGEFTTVVAEATGTIQSCNESRALRLTLATVASRPRHLRIDTDVTQPGGHPTILAQYLTDMTVAGNVSFTPRSAHFATLELPTVVCQNIGDSELAGFVELDAPALDDVSISFSASLDGGPALTVDPSVAVLHAGESSATFRIELPPDVYGRVVLVATSGAEVRVADCDIVHLDADLQNIDPSDVFSTIKHWRGWLKNGFCVSHSVNYQVAAIHWWEWPEFNLDQGLGRGQAVSRVQAPSIRALNSYGAVGGSVSGLPAVYGVRTASWITVAFEAGEVIALSDTGWIGMRLFHGAAAVGRLTPDDGLVEQRFVAECEPTDINGRGDIVGYRFARGRLHGVIDRGGQERVSRDVVWNAINDDGLAAGIHRDASGATAAVVMTDGRPERIDEEPGGALFVNSRGMVAGFVVDGAGVRHPAVWFPNGERALLDDGRPNWSGVATAVNDQGRVVGTMSSQEERGRTRAFDFTLHEGLADLEPRLRGGYITRIAAATGITQSGLVFVDAYVGGLRAAAVLKSVSG